MLYPKLRGLESHAYTHFQPYLHPQVRPHWFAGQALESIELGGMPGHWDSTWNDPQNQDQWFCAILPQAIARAVSIDI